MASPPNHLPGTSTDHPLHTTRTPGQPRRASAATLQARTRLFTRPVAGPVADSERPRAAQPSSGVHFWDTPPVFHISPGTRLYLNLTASLVSRVYACIDLYLATVCADPLYPAVSRCICTYLAVCCISPPQKRDMAKNTLQGRAALSPCRA